MREFPESGPSDQANPKLKGSYALPLAYGLRQIRLPVCFATGCRDAVRMRSCAGRRKHPTEVPHKTVDLSVMTESVLHLR